MAEVTFGHLAWALAGAWTVLMYFNTRDSIMRPKRREAEWLIFYITRDVFDPERMRPDSIRYFQGHLKQYESAIEDRKVCEMLMDEGLAEFVESRRQGEPPCQAMERKGQYASIGL